MDSDRSKATAPTLGTNSLSAFVFRPASVALEPLHVALEIRDNSFSLCIQALALRNLSHGEKVLRSRSDCLLQLQVDIYEALIF